MHMILRVNGCGRPATGSLVRAGETLREGVCPAAARAGRKRRVPVSSSCGSSSPAPFGPLAGETLPWTPFPGILKGRFLASSVGWTFRKRRWKSVSLTTKNSLQTKQGKTLPTEAGGAAEQGLRARRPSASDAPTACPAVNAWGQLGPLSSHTPHWTHKQIPLLPAIGSSPSLALVQEQFLSPAPTAAPGQAPCVCLSWHSHWRPVCCHQHGTQWKRSNPIPPSRAPGSHSTKASPCCHPQVLTVKCLVCSAPCTSSHEKLLQQATCACILSHSLVITLLTDSSPPSYSIVHPPQEVFPDLSISELKPTYMHAHSHAHVHLCLHTGTLTAPFPAWFFLLNQ